MHDRGGKRLTRTGPRWRLRHAEPTVAPCGLPYPDLGDKFWDPGQH